MSGLGISFSFKSGIFIFFTYNQPKKKVLLFVLFFLPIVSYSQVEISLDDLAKGNYPLDKKGKIYYDKSYEDIIQEDEHYG